MNGGGSSNLHHTLSPKLLCTTLESLQNFDESQDAYDYQFDPAWEEYDPFDPYEALRNEYYNPDPCDYIDALRAGYTFDSMLDPI